MGFNMSAKYNILKLVTVAGTIFSVYNAFTDRLLFEDLLVVILATILLIAIARDLNKTKNWHNEEEAVPNTQKDLANVIEETIKKKLVGD